MPKLDVTGVYARGPVRGSKISHQSAREICNLSSTPPLLEQENNNVLAVRNSLRGPFKNQVLRNADGGGGVRCIHNI